MGAAPKVGGPKSQQATRHWVGFYSGQQLCGPVWTDSLNNVQLSQLEPHPPLQPAASAAWPGPSSGNGSWPISCRTSRLRGSRLARIRAPRACLPGSTRWVAPAPTAPACTQCCPPPGSGSRPARKHTGSGGKGKRASDRVTGQTRGKHLARPDFGHSGSRPAHPGAGGARKGGHPGVVRGRGVTQGWGEEGGSSRGGARKGGHAGVGRDRCGQPCGTQLAYVCSHAGPYRHQDSAGGPRRYQSPVQPPAVPAEPQRPAPVSCMTRRRPA